MDYFLFMAVVRALGKVLPGARGRRVFQTTPLGVGLELSGGVLYFALDPGRAGVYWFREPFLTEKREHFARYLEGLLKGAVVRKVFQVPGERILRLELVKLDLVGHEEIYTLVAEIMGRHSNLMVLDSEGRILEAAKRIYRDMSRVREVLPGRLYTLPPPHNRIDPFSLDREAFLELLTRDVTPTESLAHYCLFPPYALREMEYRLGAGADGPALLLRCWGVWCLMVDQMKGGKGHIYRKDGRPMGVYPLPLGHLGEGEEGPLLSVLEAFASERWRTEVLERRRFQLLKVVGKGLKKVGAILTLLRQDEGETQEAERFKKWADTLLIHVSRIPPGIGEIELEDPYQVGEEIKIPLPSGITPSQAAQKYFRRYSKLKRKAKAVAIRKKELEAKKRHLEELEWLLESAQSLEELAAMEDELLREGFIKRAKGKKKTKGAGVLPYRLFQSSQGSVILVGRHPRGNEEVTFRRSDRRDLWFHVRAYPGAHVILRNFRSDPQEIQEAAALSAYFSKARQIPSVDVDYTKRRYVRKISKAAPGMVTYTNFSTIRVKPQIPPGVVEKG